MADTDAPVVLLIDADRRVRADTAGLLRFAGYRTLEAGDGRSGLRLARERQPDIVLLELVLPKLSGLQVLVALQAAPARTPVIIVSAYARLIDRRWVADVCGEISGNSRRAVPAAVLRPSGTSQKAFPVRGQNVSRSGGAFERVVQPSQHQARADRASHRAWSQCRHPQPERALRALVVVGADELSQHGRQVLRVEGHDVVQALAPERPADTLHDSIRTR
jgi:CheY-like chemotaxis protein